MAFSISTGSMKKKPFLIGACMYLTVSWWRKSSCAAGMVRRPFLWRQNYVELDFVVGTVKLGVSLLRRRRVIQDAEVYCDPPIRLDRRRYNHPFDFFTDSAQPLLNSLVSAPLPFQPTGALRT